ncbi:unnamed protein product [Acanthosepion pharaonis]|uniref:Uncharacterized protein n=1 Tax=Acanthosepion pharaonis TaxID=158019 RepID=A0A812DVM1_ACAPH|nr:unnamed protein product [Sepia pharaonis]
MQYGQAIRNTSSPLPTREQATQFGRMRSTAPLSVCSMQYAADSGCKIGKAIRNTSSPLPTRGAGYVIWLYEKHCSSKGTCSMGKQSGTHHHPCRLGSRLRKFGLYEKHCSSKCMQYAVWASNQEHIITPADSGAGYVNLAVKGEALLLLYAVWASNEKHC